MTALTFWRLAAYGAVGFPLAALTLPVYIHVPTYYAVELGLGLAQVGFVLFLMRLWDMVTDPVIGVLSDRTRSRRGRRRLWLAAGCPLTLAAAWALFAPPEGAGLTHLAVSALALHLGWTMMMLPYSAWGAELSADYDQRSRITAAREGFVIAGTLAAAAAPLLVIGGETGAVLGILAVGVAVLLPVGTLLICLFVPDAPPAPRSQILSVRAGWAALAGNRPFRRLLTAWFLNGWANGLPATLFLLFVQYRLDLPGQTGLLLFVYFASAIVGMPAWLWLSRRIGKHCTWSLAMIWACLWFAAVPFLQPGDFSAFLAICVATGLALGADLSLPPSMQADVIDVDEAKTGEQRAGLYFALWGVATKLALAIAVGVAFPVLAWSGFDISPPLSGTEASASAGDTTVLALLYSAVPIAFKLTAIACVWRHPVDRAMQAGLRARIDKARAAPIRP